MEKFNYSGKILILAGCLLLWTSCDWKNPVSLWDEVQKEPKVIPTITQVLPEDAGSASEITIVGTDFSTTLEENKVYFDRIQATLRSASDTTLVVYRPDVTGDSLTVKVAVDYAVVVAKFYPYRLDPVVSDFGIFVDTDKISEIAIDSSENVYAAMYDYSIIKFTPDGRRDNSYSASTGTLRPTELKVGPGGALYYLYGRSTMKQISPEGGGSVNYLTFSGRPELRVFDFDENGNIYAGGKTTGLFRAQADLTTAALGLYDDFNIADIRVFNGYVYVLADSVDGFDVEQSGIWRNEIESVAGDLGATELVFDWLDAGEFSTAAFKSFTFAGDGTIYVGTDYSASPVFVLRDGVMSPLFYGLIPATADQLVWGNGDFLYINVNLNTQMNSGGQLLRVTAGKAGAPYYGRQL